MAKAILRVAIALAPAYGLPRPEDPSQIYAVGEKGAALMAPPEVVASAYAKGLTWTADGSALVVERLVVDGAKPQDLLVARQRENLAGIEEVSRRREIVGWNLRTKRSRVIWAFDPASTSLGWLRPVPAGDRLIADLTERATDPATGATLVRKSYLLLAVGSGTLTRLPVPDPSRVSTLELSPTGRIAIVQHSPDYRNRGVALVGSDGKVGRLLPLPERSSFSFAEDGRPTVAILKPADEKGRRRFERHYLDPATGALGAVVPPPRPIRSPGTLTPNTPAASAVPPDFESEQTGPNPEMTVEEVRMSPRSRGVVLVLAPRKTENVGIVTGDGSDPVLSPRNDAVAYLSGGSAFVRTLTKISLVDYRAAEVLAERGRLMDRGKTIETALSMYAADADDEMPPSGANVSETVAPYARDRNVFDGFVYTFGGALPVVDPGSVQLGYIPGSGGRVVVYGDGSVKWVPN